MNNILENLTLILNIVLIADLVLGLIIGFSRGAFKAIFNAVSYVILLIVGFIVSTPIAQALMDVNISSFNINVNGVAVQTINAQTPEIMAKLLNVDASVFSEGSSMLNLAYGIETMIIRIAVLIVWIILCATIFHWLLGIVYAIIKPKAKKDDSGKKIKRHKSFGSRCTGGLVGILHAGVNIFLLVMILAGVISIGESAMSISDTMNSMNNTNTQTTYATVIMDPLMYNDALDENASSDEYAEIKTVIAQYKASYFHYISDFKINNQSVAESTFDKVFTFTSEDQKVAIREELANAAQVCEIVSEDLGSLDADSIAQMDVETFNKIWAYIKSMDIIKVVIPVAIDYVDNSGILQEMFGEDVKIDLESTMAVLKTLDYSVELDHIGNIIVTLIETGVLKVVMTSDGNIDIATLNISNATISTILDNLSQMKLTDAIGTIGLGYLISSDSFNNLVTKYNLDKEALSANLSQIKLSEEIGAIKDIVKVFTDMGISIKDISSLDDIDFNSISDENLKALADAIMESHLLSENTQFMTQIAIGLIPSEYQSYFSAVKLDSTDLYNFLCLAKILINQGLLDNTESVDIMGVVANLSQDDMASLANTIIDLSDLVDINGLLNFVAKNYLGTYLPDGFYGLDNIDWSAESGRQELITLFSIAQNVVASGAIKDNNLDFNALDYDALSELLSQSIIIKNNISPMVENALKSQSSISDLTLTMLDSSDWTKEEFNNLFSVVKVVNELGLLKEDLAISQLTLSDAQMDSLANALTSSKFISLNMPTLINYLIKKVELNFTLPTLETSDFTYDEYMSLFKLVNVANECGVLKSDFSLETLSLSDSEISDLATALSGSKIISHNIGTVLNSLLKANNMDITLDINESYCTTEEYTALFKSAMLLKDTGIMSGSFDLSTLDTASLASNLAQSQILSHNMNTVLAYAFSQISALKDTEWVYLDSYSYSELKALLDTVKDILTTNLLEGDTNLTDSQIDAISLDASSSSFIKANLTSLIKTALKDNDSVPASFISNLPTESNDWTYDNIKGVLVAARELTQTEADMTSIAQIDETTLTTMLKSTVLSSIIKEFLVQETTDGSLKGVLVLSETALNNFNDQYINEVLVKGELHKLLDTVKVILNDSTCQDISSLTLTNLLAVDSATLCQSRIIEDTAIEYIKKASTDNLKDLLIINISEDAWYDQYTNNVRQEGELGYFLDGVKALIGTNGDIDSLESLTLSTLLANINAINQSAILSDTMINALATHGGSVLSVPSAYDNTSASYDKSLWTTGGELNRLLTALATLLGTDTALDNINLDSLDLDVILKNDSVLLESIVFEATAIKYVKETLEANNSIVIPTDSTEYYYLQNTTYFPSQTLVWEKNSQGDGELRDLLNALKVVLDSDGDGNYSDIDKLNCDINLFMSLSDEQIKTLCVSRVMEATITKVVTPIITTTMKDYITVPTAGFRWYREANEQKPYRTFSNVCGLLRGLKALKEAGVNYDSINFSDLMAADSVKVASALYDYSDILRGSIAQFMNKIVDDQVATLPSMVQNYTKSLLSENTKYVYTDDDFTSQSDVKTELDAINNVLNS